MSPKRSFHVISILLFLFFCICPSVFAAFNLLATPNDGGFDLRFNRVSPNDFKVAKEVTLRTTSDIAKPYRVFQKVIVPLATSDGTPLPEEATSVLGATNSEIINTLIYDLLENSDTEDAPFISYSRETENALIALRR